MLLTKEVEVRVAPAFCSYYANKGYDVPKHQDKKGKWRYTPNQIITVNVFDLTPKSKVNVLVKCDYCGCEYEDYWDNIRKVIMGEQVVNKMACPNCMIKKYSEVACIRNDERIGGRDDSFRDKDWLYQEYIVKNRTAQDIADQCNIDVRNLRKYIENFGFCLKMGDIYEKMPKDLLYKEYAGNHKSVYVIADEYNLSIESVRKLLLEYEIPVRTYQESMRIYYDEHNGREIKRQQSLEIWANDDFRAKMCEINKQSANMDEHRIALSAALQHISVEEWTGYISSENKMIRHRTEYSDWRNAVFVRDNYTCQCCGARNKSGNGKSVYLHAHHLEGFANNPDLRFDVNNGVTLCRECHDPRFEGSFHNVYGTMNNTKEQFNEYIKQRQIKFGIAN